MYEVMKLVTTDVREGKTWQVADPAVVIPATVEHIQAVLKGDELALALEQLGTDVAASFVDQARRIPEAAWESALLPKPAILSPEDVIRVQVRAQALQLAWAWFRRALSVKVDGPVLLHITKNETYRE